MKKIISIILILMFFLCGCSGRNKNEVSSVQITEPEKTTSKDSILSVKVQTVSPRPNPNICFIEWIPVTEELLKSASSVFVGTITEVNELSMSYEYMGTEVTDYWSLLKVSVSDIIKTDNEMAENDSVDVLFELSSYRADENITIKKGESYIFYLKKTTEISSVLDYSKLADYMYFIPASVFIPVDNKQNSSILSVIGCNEELTGASFINALREYYE